VKSATRWHLVTEGQRGYCMGYIDALRTVHSPKLAYRALDGKGREIAGLAANDECSIGMVAGFPTAAQYEEAAASALRTAAVIKARTARHEARRRAEAHDNA